MAADATAFVLGSAAHATRVLRRFVQASFGLPMTTHTAAISPTTTGGGHGVVGTNDLAVTYSSGTTVSVAKGSCVLAGPLLAQGAYTWGNDAAANVVLDAHHATLPRIDLVVVRVRDTDEDASGSEDAGLSFITGTAAGSPSPPSIPAGGTYLVLAQVAVPATSGALVVTDKRPYATAIGGRHRCTSATRPTSGALWEGLEIYEMDTNRVYLYDGSAWELMSEPVQSWSVTSVGQPGPVTCTTSYGWSQRQRGGTFDAEVKIVFTADGVSGDPIQISSPYTLANLEAIGGSFIYYRNGVTIYAGSIWPVSTTVFGLQTSGSAGQLGDDPAFAIESSPADALHITLKGRAA